MTDKTEGLDVVAWMRRDGMKAMPADEKVGWEQSPRHSDVAEDYTVPLVYLASARAAVAAAQVQRESTNRCLDADLQRITALESALAQMTEQRDLMQQEIYTLNRLLKIAHDGPRIAALDAALRQARDALDVATNSLGSFTMDHGCSQVDFDNTDTALAALCTLNQILK